MIQQDIELLNEIYKGCEMGLLSLDELIPDAPGEEIRKELSAHRKDLTEIQSKALRIASDQNDAIKETGLMKEMMVKGSTKMNLMKDNSPPHFAEMLIQGSTMGITTITRLLHEKENYHPEIKKLAEQMVRLEEDNIEKMKKFL